MRRILVLLICITMLFTATSCSGSGRETGSSDSVNRNEGANTAAEEALVEEEPESTDEDAEDEAAEDEYAEDEEEEISDPFYDLDGEYVSGRAVATVTFVNDIAFVTIEWGGSAWEVGRWIMAGAVDPETMKLEYFGCTKSIVKYDDKGEVESEEAEYNDGSGTIIFNQDGSQFTWKDNKSKEAEMVFEKA